MTQGKKYKIVIKNQTCDGIFTGQRDWFGRYRFIYGVDFYNEYNIVRKEQKISYVRRKNILELFIVHLKK